LKWERENIESKKKGKRFMREREMKEREGKDERELFG
jgi:hypothetical protein